MIVSANSASMAMVSSDGDIHNSRGKKGSDFITNQLHFHMCLNYRAVSADFFSSNFITYVEGNSYVVSSSD